MDDELKVILSGTLRTLQKIPAHERSWERIMGDMRQNSLLETTPHDEVTRVDSLAKEGLHAFNFDGNPDSAIVNEVRVLLSYQEQNIIHCRAT